ncbi:MAG: hypothetical protein ACREHD_22395, partial [Pirellulales bacterium]
MRLSCQTRGAPRRLSVLSAALLAIVAVAVLPHLRAQEEPSAERAPRPAQPVGTSDGLANQKETDALAVQEQKAQTDEKDERPSPSVELPPLEQRERALKIITGAGGRAWPDVEKLMARGETRDLFSPKHAFVTANLERATLTDRVVGALEAFPELDRLELGTSAITDDQLAKLPLRNLKYLDLHGTAVTDQGIEHLWPLKKLRYLDLSRTRVTSKGLATLATLRDLQAVGLDETRVDDTGVAFLAKLPKLDALSLNKTTVGDAALEHL